MRKGEKVAASIYVFEASKWTKKTEEQILQFLADVLVSAFKSPLKNPIYRYTAGKRLCSVFFYDPKNYSPEGRKDVIKWFKAKIKDIKEFRHEFSDNSCRMTYTFLKESN